jgi:phage gpG-like protein
MIPVVFPQISIGEGFYPEVLVFAENIDRLAMALRDFRDPLTESVNTVIIPSISQNFDSEGRPPWAELAESTVEQRGDAHPILNRTGSLKSAATSFGIWFITNSEASIQGIDKVHYAKFHQGGTINMPARPFIGYQDQDVDQIEGIFSIWLDENIRIKGGFR